METTSGAAAALARGVGEADQRLDDLRRSPRAMILTRFVAVPWALVEVLTRTLPPYPPGGRLVGVVLAAGLALGNAAL